MKSDDVKAAANDGLAKAGKSAETTADEVSRKALGAGDALQDYASGTADKAAGVYGSVKAKISDATAQLPGSASDAIDAGPKGLCQRIRAVRETGVQAANRSPAAGWRHRLPGWLGCKQKLGPRVCRTVCVDDYVLSGEPDDSSGLL